MLDNYNFSKYSKTYSNERLSAFVYKENATLDNIVTNYQNNIRISQALYPELCTLEIILRNSINTVLEEYISKTWIEDEIKNNSLLDTSEYKILLKVYDDTKNECLLNSKTFTVGRVVANLNFGFWTNLCVKKYNSKIWNKPKCFYGVFVNYPYKYSINKIAKTLYSIRRLRNRVFHYEKIFKYPEKTLSIYNDILEILSYLSHDELEILKQTTTFLDTYNNLMRELQIGNKKT